jgi:hypothetical protein
LLLLESRAKLVFETGSGGGAIMKKLMGYAMATAIASVAILTHSTTIATAGPLPINPTAIKAAAPNDLLDAHYYHRHYRGGAVAAGLALGLLGAAIASGGYAYPGPYYYYPPYPYYPAYGYYGPYWGGPYVAYGAYPVYRYYGVRHYRPRHRIHR